MPRIYKIFFDIYLLDIIRRQEILLIIVYITNRYTYMLCCIIIIKYIETMRLIARALLSPIPDNNNNNFYDIYRQIYNPIFYLSVQSLSYISLF